MKYRSFPVNWVIPADEMPPIGKAVPVVTGPDQDVLVTAFLQSYNGIVRWCYLDGCPLDMDPPFWLKGVLLPNDQPVHGTHTRSQIITYLSSFGSRSVDDNMYFREDTGDSTTQENEDLFHDLLDELRPMGWTLRDVYIEHDCITGQLDVLGPDDHP